MDKINLIRDAVAEYYERWFCYPTCILMNHRFQYELIKEMHKDFSLSELDTIQMEGAKMKVYRSSDISETEVKVF